MVSPVDCHGKWSVRTSWGTLLMKFLDSFLVLITIKLSSEFLVSLEEIMNCFSVFIVTSTRNFFHFSRWLRVSSDSKVLFEFHFVNKNNVNIECFPKSESYQPIRLKCFSSCATPEMRKTSWYSCFHEIILTMAANLLTPKRYVWMPRSCSRLCWTISFKFEENILKRWSSSTVEL